VQKKRLFRFKYIYPFSDADSELYEAAAAEAAEQQHQHKKIEWKIFASVRLGNFRGKQVRENQQNELIGFHIEFF
jgi:hypothetical protein